MKTKQSCLECGGAGCKACFVPESPKVFLPVAPMPYVRTTGRQKFVDERYKKYAAYKEHVGMLAAHYIDYIDKGNAIEVELTFHMPIPASWSKKKKEEHEGRPHINTPDVDNLVKGFFDAVNKFIWVDDNQVFKVTATKIYSSGPGIEVGVTFYE